jgi:hypothetical protein
MRIPTSQEIALLAAAIATSGCLSVDPADFHVAPRDSSVPDTIVAETSSDGDAPLTCRQCIERPDDPGPGCGTEVEKCRASAKCKQVYDCVYANDCWSHSVESEFIACGFPCAVEAGIISTDDPDVQAAIAIARCELKACAGICYAVDAGP